MLRAKLHDIHIIIGPSGMPVALYEVDLLNEKGERHTGAVGTWHEIVWWARVEVARYEAAKQIPVADYSAIERPILPTDN